MSDTEILLADHCFGFDQHMTHCVLQTGDSETHWKLWRLAFGGMLTTINLTRKQKSHLTVGRCGTSKSTSGGYGVMGRLEGHED